MSPKSNGCSVREQLFEYALGMLAPDEAASVGAHVEGCSGCRRELEDLRPVVQSFLDWPTDVLRPTSSLWERVAERVTAEAGPRASLTPRSDWIEPGWEQAAPGISCKLLATDKERHRVSMLVRLAPRTAYPPHRHAGVEELHLLEGELFIEDRKLLPGDYNFGPPGHLDKIVYSETGCTCVLVTSTRDEIC